MTRGSLTDWIKKLLQPGGHPFPSGIDKEHLLHFLAVACEYTWKLRNQLRNGSSLGDWKEHFRLINAKGFQYWHASFNRKSHANVRPLTSWKPPPAGWLKVNVDTTVRLDKATLSCIIRDHLGKTIGGWIAEEQVFDVETKGFLLACRVGVELKSKQILD